MLISNIINYLEEIAPPGLQENYDNSGLLVGDVGAEITGLLISLDCIEVSIHEAIAQNCNLVVAHHPIIFSGLKRFNNANYVQRTVQLAIKNDVAIYAIHTNLDNIYNHGVNSKIAERLGLVNTRVLVPRTEELLKLVTYCPVNSAEAIKAALFKSGAGNIGRYSECSFSTMGKGTFKAGIGANPFVGEIGIRHTENEEKIEVLLHKHQLNKVLEALKVAHPYEEVAYEMSALLNSDENIGSGMIGELPDELSIKDFLEYLKLSMNLEVIKYTNYSKSVKKIAICGGSGAFLLPDAKSSGADVYVTSDFKYHEFFDAEDSLMICDIGHYESEKFTIDLLYDILREKFTTFAVLKTAVNTNPVKYFI
jgi:dinuclear metal center YbgI/SA1388 family protein